MKNIKFRDRLFARGLCPKVAKRRKRRMRLRLSALIILFIVFSAIGSLAKNNGYIVVGKGEVTITAFNSMESQTDSTPWITASGTRCRPGVIASNFLPFGTKVIIEGFGNRIFTVEDRMNKRYYKRLDIWFANYADAKKFGVRRLKYYVLKNA